MVHTTCAVRDCKSSSRINKDLRFHQLPRTEERCKLWVEACKRPDLLEMTFRKIKNTFNENNIGLKLFEHLSLVEHNTKPCDCFPVFAMSKYSENYNLRQFYLQHDQVPSQSMMRQKMSPALAAVYFDSMAPRYKVLAGLEPPMKGGGHNWLVCPKTVLKGKTVLKPIATKHLARLNYIGVGELGTDALQRHEKGVMAEKRKMLTESDNKWKDIVRKVNKEHWEKMSDVCKNKNREYLWQIFDEFSKEYKTSINRIEQLLTNAADDQLVRIQKEATDLMNKRYQDLLKYQFITITDSYRKKLHDEETRLKSKFLEDIETTNDATANTIHCLKEDKLEAVANLRKYLECQNLACQIYVLLKEQETYDKKAELSQHDHKKKIKTLALDIAAKDLTTTIAKEIIKIHEEELDQRRQILCKIVKKFQLFVTYCLNTLPEHAEFFINLEKLMLLQVSEILQNPSAASVIVKEPEEIQAPTPPHEPRPFYLFCDRGYKAEVNQAMCPTKRASSASQLPAIVVNQRCIYAACENLYQFTDKFKSDMFDKSKDNVDCKDDLNHDHLVPVNYTSSQQVTELKLQSSLLQILHEEAISRKNDNVFNCESCEMPYCYCASKTGETKPKEQPVPPVPSIDVLPEAGRSTVLEHEREPKLERYLKYIKPEKCACPKTIQRHLEQSLPAYMTNTSEFEAFELENYEKCSMTTLKRLVDKQNHQVSGPSVRKVARRTKDASTQYSDVKFDWLCTCFCRSDVDLLLRDYIIGQKPYSKSEESSVSFDRMSSSFLMQNASSFATERAQSLRKLLNDSPELQEIFIRKKC